MARIFVSTALIIISLLFAGLPLNASVEFQADLFSRYIWRGFDLNPDNRPVFQPSVTLNIGESGLSVNVWGSFAFNDRELNETDVTLSYDRELSEKLSLSAGIVHYGWYFIKGFRFNRDTTHEVYLSLSTAGSIVDTSISVYYDFDKGDGLYFMFGLERSIRINERTGVDLSLSAGYNSGQWIDGSGLSDITLSASLPFETGRLTVSPIISLTVILLDEINPARSEFVAGISFIF